MKYRNKVTGVEIIVPCALDGPDWEEIGETEPVKAETTAKKPARKKVKEPDTDG